jgi:NarL family two-component system sensor histidine kinase YdfH
LLLHASLYALSLLQRIPRRWHWLYVVGQGVVIISINFLLTPPNALIVTAALSLALIGEAVVTWREPGPITFTVVSAVLLFILSIALRVGWLAFHHDLLYLIPLALVIVGYVVLYLRLTRAHEHAEALLHELEAAHGALANYAARVEELTLVNERQRLARELHDTLAQGLAGLSMQLDAVDALLSEKIHRKRKRLCNGLWYALAPPSPMLARPSMICEVVGQMGSVAVKGCRKKFFISRQPPG